MQLHQRCSTPVVFVSYSWDSEEHQAWVKKLVTYLQHRGAEVLFDGNLKLGQRLPKFMEQSIARADYVVVICTEGYKLKADGRNGGVGYETNIISADLFATSGLTEEKYIPVLRSGTWGASLPAYMAGKLGVDCTDGVIDDRSMADLLTTFGLDTPKEELEINGENGTVPACEGNEFEQKNDEDASADEIKITGIILDEVTQPRMDGTRGSALYRIPFRLSDTPAPEWKQFFLKAWDLPPRFTTMHRPGIASVIGDTIVLDGTTIDEVAEYHRDTLVLCVERANQEYDELCRQREQVERKRREQEEHQRNHLADVARKIEF